MDPYIGYIAASYGVAFGAIFLLVAGISLRSRSASATIERLKQDGVKRRSDSSRSKP